MSSQADVVELNMTPLAVKSSLSASECDRESPERNANFGTGFRYFRIHQGGIYLGLRYGLGVLISIGNMFVLTWWIGPRAYGVFVTAIGLTTFLVGLTRNGIDTYLVRRVEKPDRSLYDVASTLILAFSVALLAFGVAAVPLLRRWYGNSEFVGPYLALLVTSPLVGLAGPATAKLDRELKFTLVAQIELSGQFLALIVSLLLAWRGFGVWAPVAGQLAWQISGTIAALAAAGFVPRLRFDRAVSREMLTFGAGYTASIRTWQLRTLVNPLLVGRLVGAEGVAYVGFAIRVAEGLGFIRVAAARLAIAGLAALQKDRKQIRAALESAQTIQVIVLGPLLCAFALTSPYVVPALLGARWTPSLQVFPFVALGVLVNSIFNLQASALFVIGKQWLVLKAFALHAGLLVVSTVLLVPLLGIVGYGWADLIACGGYLFLQDGISRTIGISYRKLLPWAVAFAAPLFAPLLRPRWSVTLLLPFLAAVAIWQWGRIRYRIGSGEGQIGREIARQMRHVLTFVLKARQRGPTYVLAVATYVLRSFAYSVGMAVLPRIKRILKTRTRDANGRQLQPSRFHFLAEEIPRITDSVPDSLKERTLAEATHILDDCFTFRGITHRFPGAINWRTRPQGNRSWEWDLNRHRYFLTLGTAYYYSGREQCLDKLIELWDEWIAANPVAASPAWGEPFEVATRLRNWIFAFCLLERSGKASQVRLDSLVHAICTHAHFLYSHLEYHWPNNHLLLEAKALYEAALVFPDHDRSRAWSRRGAETVEREIVRQISSDGAHVENCSMYHRIISGELHQLAMLCRRLGRPLSPQAEDRIQKSIEFSAAMLRRDGTAALLGDSAMDDTNLRFEFAQPASRDLNYWVQPATASASAPPHGSAHLQSQISRDSGYAFITSRDSERQFHLSFDFGPFSRCPAANHAHADALSFELYAHRRPLIVDPGVYLPWGDDGAWARYFRSTAAHNTLVIDGKDQSRLCEYADVGGTAETNLVYHEASAHRVTIVAECTPYWAKRTEIRHIRHLTCEDDGAIAIVDEVTGSGVHRLEWFFHFASTLHAGQELDGSISLRAAPDGLNILRLRPNSPEALNVCLKGGETDPLCGWVSSNSAQVQPAYVALFSADVQLPFSTSFNLHLGA